MFSKDSVFIENYSLLRHANLFLYLVSASVDIRQSFKSIILVGILRNVPLIQSYSFGEPDLLFQCVQFHVGVFAHERDPLTSGQFFCIPREFGKDRFQQHCSLARVIIPPDTNPCKTPFTSISKIWEMTEPLSQRPTDPSGPEVAY